MSHSILSHSDRDFPEDALTDPDNGAYSCVCVSCKKGFTGHKRRVCCKACEAVIDAEHDRRQEILAKAGLEKGWVLMKEEEVVNMHKQLTEQGMYAHDMTRFCADLSASLKEIYDWTSIKSTPWAENAKELLEVAVKIGMIRSPLTNPPSKP